MNTTRPELTLSKKHHSIDYHCAQEAAVEGIVRVSKKHTSNNLAGIFTNIMAAPKIEGLLENFTY